MLPRSQAGAGLRAASVHGGYGLDGVVQQTLQHLVGQLQLEAVRVCAVVHPPTLLTAQLTHQEAVYCILGGGRVVIIIIRDVNEPRNKILKVYA